MIASFPVSSVNLSPASSHSGLVLTGGLGAGWSGLVLTMFPIELQQLSVES